MKNSSVYVAGNLSAEAQRAKAGCVRLNYKNANILQLCPL